MMKRMREEDDQAHNITTIANYSLMLLSGAGGAHGGRDTSRVFTCKTCDRQFSSFQALGGHRASHKKPRVMVGDHNLQLPLSPPKPKTHECSICGLEFPIGQALGGHMRRHRANNNNNIIGHHDDHINNKEPQLYPFLSLSPPVVKKLPNNRRVLCLDLNLTPSENKFMFGKIIPAVDCLF